MRQEILDTTNRAEAVRLCPWALYVAPIPNGYYAFESHGDFKRWQALHNHH